MSNFYAQICSNGHVLINRHPSDDNEYCEICGAKMLSKCPNCNSTIREWHYNGVTVLGSVKYERPNYCKSCGKAFLGLRQLYKVLPCLYKKKRNYQSN